MPIYWGPRAAMHVDNMDAPTCCIKTKACFMKAFVLPGLRRGLNAPKVCDERQRETDGVLVRPRTSPECEMHVKTRLCAESAVAGLAMARQRAGGTDRGVRKSTRTLIAYKNPPVCGICRRRLGCGSSEGRWHGQRAATQTWGAGSNGQRSGG
jgi:hypothetical protein